MKSANKVQLGLRRGAMSGQAGFTLITALFLLIVVAGLSVYMITIRNVQQSTVVFAQQGARAMQAARAGIEWGVYESVVNGNCIVNPPFTASGTALGAYSITVNCTSSAHDETGIPITTYVLSSTAQAGSYGSLDYVSRRLRATVSVQPP
jgi:MSHA biogenesis protein MshP